MKRIQLFIVTCILVLGIQAQDLHFSQFYAVPVTLNPALGGFFDGNFRVSGIHRSQWLGFAPFNTQAVSFEKPLKSDPYATSQFSLAALIINDKAGMDAGLSTMKGYGNISMQMDLGPFYLGAGLQAGYVQRRLFGVNSFPDQWDQITTTFNTGLATDEEFLENVGYVDINAGLLAAFTFGSSVKQSLMGGVSLFHVHQPTEQFVTGGSVSSVNRMPMRMVGHISGRFQFASQSPFSIVPNALYMAMPTSSADQFNTGIDLETDLTKFISGLNYNLLGVIGGYYRWGDSYIAHIGIQVSDFTIGGSYDFNGSALKAATNMKGGFELSLRFNPTIGQVKRVLVAGPPKI